jgi:hypothetical protein
MKLDIITELAVVTYKDVLSYIQNSRYTQFDLPYEWLDTEADLIAALCVLWKKDETQSHFSFSSSSLLSVWACGNLSCLYLCKSNDARYS